MSRTLAFAGGTFLTVILLTACTPEGQAWFWPLEREQAASSSAPASANAPSARSASSSTASSQIGTAAQSSGRSRVRLTPGALGHLSPPPVPVFTPDPDLTIPILVYHHVRPQQGWSKATWSWKMTVSPGIFERQMAWLAEHGYQSVDLDTAVAMLRDGAPGPRKPVVLTFDDNQLNAYEAGVPIMEKYDMRAVWYILTDRLDQEGVINRARVLDLHARGHSIQSHTMSHPVLTALPVHQIDWQLHESKRVLEELIGRPVLHVAYPGTAHNPTVRERTRLAGYVTGSIMDPRRATGESDLWKLPRIMMTDDTDLAKVLP